MQDQVPDAFRRKTQIQVFAYVIHVDQHTALELNCQRMAVYVVRLAISRPTEWKIDRRSAQISIR